jgi:hypothetical protein
MATRKIKRATKQQLAEKTRKQGAIPCLILVALALIGLAVLLYFSLKSGLS